MKTRSILSFCLLSLAGTALASEAPAVARIGTTEIKITELQSELNLLNPTQQTALVQNPSMLNQAVRAMLIQRLVLKEATSQNWEKRADVSSQLKRLSENAVVESYLQSVTQPPVEYPDEAEIKAVFEQNKAALMVPRQLQLSQIFVALPQGGSEEDVGRAKQRIDAAGKQLSAKPFAELVGLYSEEKSGEKEAELQWVTEAQLQPAIRDAVKSLSKGGVAKPVQLEDGWHLVKVIGVRESRAATFEEVREPLKQRLRLERQQAERIEYVNGLLKENPISINELELSKLLQSSAR